MSLGSNCYVSWTLRKIGLQKVSYPIDWVNTFRFSGLLDFIDEFSDDTLQAFERSPIDADAGQPNSYYIPKYGMRFPHEHDVNPGNDLQEMTERYARRFARLKSDCRNAAHVVFLRTNAVRTYNLPQESADEYSPAAMLRAERILRRLVWHDRFTLAVLRERTSLPAIDAPFVAVADLPIPFENGFFDADVSLPRKAEAFDFFTDKLSPLRKSRTTVEVRDILSRLSAPKQKNPTRALGFLQRALLQGHR